MFSDILELYQTQIAPLKGAICVLIIDWFCIAIIFRLGLDVISLQISFRWGL